MNLHLVARWFRDHLLLLWFLMLSIGWLDSQFLGIDGRIYGAAARAWLSGDDPWSAGADGYLFAAAPPSLLFAAPLTLLPTWLDGPVSVGVALGAGIVALRSLRLPIWWLLFPPLADGIWVGNLDAVALALLLTRLGALAVLAKVYAGIPLLLLARWRDAAVASVLLLATIPLLPWVTYAARFAEISATLATQSTNPFSAFATPLMVPAIVAMVALGRRQAAWLVVPALWPSTQLHYATLALPVARRWGALLGLPVPYAVPLTAIAWAVTHVGSLYRRWSSRAAKVK